MEKINLKLRGAAVFLSLAVSLTLAVPAFASIIIKVMAVNPSKDKVQTASVKAYLPKEVKPDDILNKGDLQSIYDNQQGAYFVFGDVVLKPGEVFEQEVELKDIWLIADEEIGSLRFEAQKLEEMLKNTEYAERSAFLSQSIRSKLDQIAESQKFSPANPEVHISGYRDNLKALEAVKADLILARSMLAQAKSFPMGTVVHLMVGIIAFLGLLGGSFYFFWYREVRAVAAESAAKVAVKVDKEGLPEKRGADGAGNAN